MGGIPEREAASVWVKPVERRAMLLDSHLAEQALENAYDLLSKGENIEHIAPRLGMTIEALTKLMERKGL